jgi:competence protein ComEC
VIARPSLPLFVAAGCGALVGLLAGLAWWPLAGLALLAGGAACVATTRVARAALLLATAATLAAAAGSLEAKRALQRRAQLPDGIVILDGVVDDVIATPYGWRSLVDVDGVLDPAPRPLTLRVSVMSDALRARPGDHVRVRGVLRAPEPADAPGQLDGRRYALALGIDASLSAYAPTDIAVLARERAWRPFALLRLALRDRLTSLLTPREAGLVLALVVGDTSLIDPEQRELYRAVGAGHLLAVSGLQVSLIALLLRRALMSLLLLTPPGRRVRGRALASIIALACVWSFVMVCGAPASAVRAGAMASALLAAEILGRRASALDSLGIAGLFTILLSPQSVLDASFLLSYAAVIGLAAAMRPRANDFDDDAAASASPPILTKLRDGAITCLGAGLVTLPVSAWLFGQVSLSGIFANIVVVPAAALLQIPSIALGLLGALCDSAFIARLGAQTALLLEALRGSIAGHPHGGRAERRRRPPPHGLRRRGQRGGRARARIDRDRCRPRGARHLARRSHGARRRAHHRLACRPGRRRRLRAARWSGHAPRRRRERAVEPRSGR